MSAFLVFLDFFFFEVLSSDELLDEEEEDALEASEEEDEVVSEWELSLWDEELTLPSSVSIVLDALVFLAALVLEVLDFFGVFVGLEDLSDCFCLVDLDLEVWDEFLDFVEEDFLDVRLELSCACFAARSVALAWRSSFLVWYDFCARDLLIWACNCVSESFSMVKVSSSIWPNLRIESVSSRFGSSLLSFSLSSWSSSRSSAEDHPVLLFSLWLSCVGVLTVVINC